MYLSPLITHHINHVLYVQIPDALVALKTDFKMDLNAPGGLLHNRWLHFWSVMNVIDHPINLAGMHVVLELYTVVIDFFVIFSPYNR